MGLPASRARLMRKTFAMFSVRQGLENDPTAAFFVRVSHFSIGERRLPTKGLYLCRDSISNLCIQGDSFECDATFPGCIPHDGQEVQFAAHIKVDLKDVKLIRCDRLLGEDSEIWLFEGDGRLRP